MNEDAMENGGFAEFAEAFGVVGNQTDNAEEVAQVPQDEPDTTSTEDSAAVEEQTEPVGDDAAIGEEHQAPADPETFTLKVNREERTVNREEVITLAQKGADYDRVKDQLSESRKEQASLQSKLDGMQETMSLLDDIAAELKVDIPTMLDNLRINVMMQQGMTKNEATERIARLKAEKENARLKAAPAEKQPAAETAAQRAQREVAEFRKAYPNVELSDNLLKALEPDVQDGMSMVSAYQKYDNARKDAQIAELQRQLAAEKKNRENRATSPGSQRDSGGQRQKTDFDDFMSAFG